MKKQIMILTSLMLVLIYSMAIGGEKNNAMMMSDSSSQKNFFEVANLGPSVVVYSGEKDAMMAAGKGKTVYFFAATWCPTCKTAYKNIVADYKKFPKNFKLIFVNYDTEKKLIKKYGVTYQHTFVQIDKRGKAIKKWSGSNTVNDIVRKTK